MVEKITDEETYRKIIEDDRYTVIDFYTEWCGPCKRIKPKFEETSKKYPDVKFCSIDVDEMAEISAENYIVSIPTFIIFKSGRVIEEYVGDFRKVEKFLSEKN